MDETARPHADLSPESPVVRARLREVLRRSRDAMARGSEVAAVGDEWFQAGIGRVHGGGLWILTGVRRCVARIPGPWRGSPSTQERIYRLLRQEARRNGLEAEPEAFDSFSRSMASLLDLVLKGRLPVDAICLDLEDEPAGGESEVEDGR